MTAQSSGSPVSGVTGSQVTCSLVTRAQSTGTSDTMIGSRITGSQVTPSGDSSSSGTGTGSPRIGSQVVMTSSERQVSNEEVEESLRHDASSKKRKSSWLQ